MHEKRLQLADKPAGYLGTLGVGAAFGAGWTPCIGPVLGAILTYGFSQDTMWAGVGLLTVYSLGLAIPFLLAALRARLVPAGLQALPALHARGGEDVGRAAGGPGASCW